MKIVADEHIPFIRDYFSEQGQLIVKPGRDIEPHDVKDADLLIVRSITHVNQQLLAHSNVKFVGSVTAGEDHLDTQWLQQHGIAYCTAAGFNAPPVADYVVATVAALQQAGKLSNKNLRAAVIGVGHVGRLVAAHLTILGWEVTLVDPYRARHETDFISEDIKQIEEMDLISIHVPLTKHGDFPTYHAINKDFLQKQKPGCVLLNASRGAVISSSDLNQYGKHLVWCFDVWEHEPHLDQRILAQAFIATPHIAGYSVQSKIRGINLLYQKMCQLNLLKAGAVSAIDMPTQQLIFKEKHLSWQKIILGIFNPHIITMMMRTVLLSAEETGHLFDEMRNQFNYRCEFAYTEVNAPGLSTQDRTILERLKIKI